MNEVWIVFSGKADVKILRFLKPGYRHCFALIRDSDRWLMLDSMLHKMDVMTTHSDASFDLPTWMRKQGYRVIKAPAFNPARRMLIASPFTCVEAMKRLIGLQDWRVITPWQLYKKLISSQGEHNG
jgi:hypothetical protein